MAYEQSRAMQLKTEAAAASSQDNYKLGAAAAVSLACSATPATVISKEVLVDRALKLRALEAPALTTHNDTEMAIVQMAAMMRADAAAASAKTPALRRGKAGDLTRALAATAESPLQADATAANPTAAGSGIAAWVLGDQITDAPKIIELDAEDQLPLREVGRRVTKEKARLGAQEVMEKAEAEARSRAEQEAAARREIWEAAHTKAIEEARLQAYEDARLKAEARLTAEQEARIMAEEAETRLKAEATACQKAIEEARQKAAEEARLVVEQEEARKQWEEAIESARQHAIEAVRKEIAMKAELETQERARVEMEKETLFAKAIQAAKDEAFNEAMKKLREEQKQTKQPDEKAPGDDREAAATPVVEAAAAEATKPQSQSQAATTHKVEGAAAGDEKTGPPGVPKMASPPQVAAHAKTPTKAKPPQQLSLEKTPEAAPAATPDPRKRSADSMSTSSSSRTSSTQETNVAKAAHCFSHINSIFCQLIVGSNQVPNQPIHRH